MPSIRAETGRIVDAQFACAEDNIAHVAPVRQIACCCCEGWLLAAQPINVTPQLKSGDPGFPMR